MRMTLGGIVRNHVRSELAVAIDAQRDRLGVVNRRNEVVITADLAHVQRHRPILRADDHLAGTGYQWSQEVTRSSSRFNLRGRHFPDGPIPNLEPRKALAGVRIVREDRRHFLRRGLLVLAGTVENGLQVRLVDGMTHFASLNRLTFAVPITFSSTMPLPKTKYRTLPSVIVST